MALPRGWDETANEWRVRLRAPGRFTRIRPKPLEGIKGVYMVGGPLKRGDREYQRHAGGAFVPQALRFKREEWPSLTAAVGWFEASRFAGGELDNPPGERRRVFGGKYELERGKPYQGMIQGVVEQFLAYGKRGAVYGGLVWQDGRFHWMNATRPLGNVPFDLAQVSPLVLWEGGRRGTPPALKENPTRRIHRGQLRLGAFRAGVDEAIEKLVRTETELTAVMAQALELVDRGEKVPEWIRARGRGLELERASELEAVRTAVARHAAVLEELQPGPAPKRRENPAGDRRVATELYREFHGGAAPRSFHFEHVPDLSQLVHLGRALRMDYQAARPRGSTNTPYRHEFDRGSELFTDRTGRALVILGNMKVSRAPRGRFGYIRAGAR